MISFVRNTFEGFIFTEYSISPTSLGLIRILYSCYMLLIIGVPDLGWISIYPDYFFQPPQYSIGGLFENFPPSAYFEISRILLVIFLCFLLFGFKTKLAGILISLLFILNFNFLYSFGKINHDTLYYSILPLIMSFSCWGAEFSILPKQEKQINNPSWPIALLALLYSFSLFSAGVPKLLSGYLDISYSAVYTFVEHYYYGVGRNLFLISFFAKLDSAIFWEIIDYLTVIWEVGFLIAVFKRKIFRWFIITGIFFHLVTLLMLNISFVGNIPIYLLFLNWKVWESRLNKFYLFKGFYKLLTMKVFIVITALFVLRFLLFRLPNPVWLIATSSGKTLSLIVLLTVCLIWIIDFRISFYTKQNE